MSRTKRPVVSLGPITLRALAGEPGAWRWRAEWYPPGLDGRMESRSLSHRRGERFGQDEAIARAAVLLGEGVHLPASQRRNSEKRRSIETVLDLLEAWLGAQRDRVGAGLRASSHTRYRAMVRMLKSQPITSIRLSEVTHQHTVRLLGGLRARYADRTVVSIMTGLKAAYAWGVTVGAVRAAPRWPTWRPEYPAQHMPSVADVLATMRALEGIGPDRTSSNRRAETLLAVQLMLETGARPGECAAARREDFCEHTQRWHIRDGKTGARYVPIQPGLLARMLALPDGPIFPPVRSASSTTRAWNRWIQVGATEAGVPVWTCKGLRHLAVTRMLTAGVDIKTASSITGHSPVVLLNSYAHALESSRRRASELLSRMPTENKVLPFPTREVQ